MVDIWAEECMNRSSFKGEASKPRKTPTERVECEPGHHQWQRVDPVAGYDFGCTRCGKGVQDDE